MATLVTETPEYFFVGGVRYIAVSWDAATETEYQLAGVPPVCTLTLFEIVTENGEGTAHPKIGTVAGIPANSLALVVENRAKGAHIRNQTAVKITTSSGNLYVQPGLGDSATGATIRVTLREGH